MSSFMDKIFVKAVTYINFNIIHTRTYTHRYEFLLPNRLPPTPRRVTAYWLTELISLHPVFLPFSLSFSICVFEL